MSALVDRIRPDYQRPKCPDCGEMLGFICLNPSGCRYACLPCEFGPLNPGADWCTPGSDDAPIGNHEASWIIRTTAGNER